MFLRLPVLDRDGTRNIYATTQGKASAKSPQNEPNSELLGTIEAKGNLCAPSIKVDSPPQQRQRVWKATIQVKRLVEIEDLRKSLRTTIEKRQPLVFIDERLVIARGARS